MARILFSDFREPAAGAAYEIAYDYLLRSAVVQDEYETFVFLAQHITEMVDQGHYNRILMANRAIAAYQKRGLAGDPPRTPNADPGFSCPDRKFR